jgi:mannose-6-phosphate isomerase-like protein (cupin superfamily)
MPVPKFLTARIVKKTWGEEQILVNTEDYCSKFLIFEKKGNFASKHFHRRKTETWYVHQGHFKFEYFDETGKFHIRSIWPGEIIHLEYGTPHQLHAQEDNSIIFEVSTKDDPADVVRIEPSMS